ncbi:MAG TPA: LuxR C-terminal-related transcriptional regulator, partial [Segeticoccus sp.]|uniref:response regulator transcription factor n=1 Tax=Segeticoccus sp. TaxID=2706531 RepID=UPI002D7E850E
PLSELLEAIHRASAGEASFPAAMLARALDDPSLDTPSSAGRPGSLSQRELEILAALADGKSRQRIAAECHISVHTVRTHVQHILGKLHAPTTLAAVRLAREAGLLELTHTGVSTK